MPLRFRHLHASRRRRIRSTCEDAGPRQLPDQRCRRTRTTVDAKIAVNCRAMIRARWRKTRHDDPGGISRVSLKGPPNSLLARAALPVPILGNRCASPCRLNQNRQRRREGRGFSLRTGNLAIRARSLPPRPRCAEQVERDIELGVLRRAEHLRVDRAILVGDAARRRHRGAAIRSQGIARLQRP